MEVNLEKQSNFVNIIYGACQKKIGLFDQSKARYFVRSMFAGAMLVLATAAGVYAADYLNVVNDHLGKFVYAALFCFGLMFILFLHHELVTSNMMYLTAGLYHKFISLNKMIQILLFCTIGNLVGALIMGFLIGKTGAFQHLTAESFIVTTVQAKLGKAIPTIFLEAIVANTYVNIAILGYLLAKNEVTKLVLVFGAIFMFVFLGYEHVVANFGSVGIMMASNFHLDAITFPALALTWTIAWIGNYIGGGLLMGLTYAWLNQEGMPMND